MRVFPNRRASIKTRIIASMLIVLICTGIIAVVAIAASNNLLQITTGLNTIDLPEILVLEQLQMNLEQQHVELQQATLYEEPASGTGAPTDKTQLQHIEQSLQSLPNALSYQRSYNDIPTEHALLINLQTYRTTVLAMLADLRNGQQKQAQATYTATYEPLMATILQQTSQLNRLEQVEAQQATAQSQQGTQQLMALIVAILVIMIFFSSFSAWFLIRSLVRPMRSLLLATQLDISSDFPKRPLKVERDDELGKLTESFNTMQEKIRNLIRSLRIEREFTQTIIDTAGDGIVVIDATGNILVANPAMLHVVEQIGGNKPGTIFALSTLVGFMPELDMNKILELSANKEQLEVKIPAQSHQYIWFTVRCSIMPIDAPSVLSMVDRKNDGKLYHLSFHDITERKRIEQAQSDFIALVSHELRAPLTSVTSSVELLQSMDPVTNHESFHEVTGILAQQTIRLNSVIEEVLLVTRIEANQQQIRKSFIEIATALTDLLQRMRVAWLGDMHTIELHITGDATTLLGDWPLLEMALRNILENARKYAYDMSSIQVFLRQNELPDMVEIAIYNQGPVISNADRERIFERFERGGDTTSYRGYGLGLYITQHILLAMQGTIFSAPCEDGAMFIIRLPKYPGGTQWKQQQF